MVGGSTSRLVGQGVFCMVAGVVTGVRAPESYDQFAQEWSGYVLGFVRKLGVPWQEAPDVAQDILVSLLQSDILAQFDPKHVVEHDGTWYDTKFKAFLNRGVETRVRGKRDALARRRKREALIMDRPVSPGSESTWADLLLGAEDDLSLVNLDSVDQLTVRLRKFLEAVPRRSSRDRCDLPAVFDCILEGVAESGEVDYEVVQKKFNISTTAARAWVRRLRECLAPVLAEEEL